MRDFDWFDELYAVIKEDGTFAGVPCRTLEEARDLASQHDGSKIFLMQYDNCNFEDDFEDDEGWIEFECGKFIYDEMAANP